jgi:hypothetical protein
MRTLPAGSDRPPRRVLSILIGTLIPLLPTLASAGAYCPEYVGSIAKEVATEDFNGDGLADFAVTVEPNAVAIVLGRAGTRPTQWIGSVPTGGAVFGIAAGDLNGDGFADVVAGNPAGGYARLLLGHGDGTFSLSDPIDAGERPARIVLADVDADGDLDVAIQRGVVDGTTTAVTLRRNRGDAVFDPPETIELPTLPTDQLDIAAGDIDGDGDADLVILGSGIASGTTIKEYAILRSNGDGTFAPVSIVAETTATSAIALSDVNGDGRADLVAKDGYLGFGGPPPNRLTTYLGKADGTLGTPIYSTQTAMALGGRLRLADMNGDGALDAILLGGPAFALVAGCGANRAAVALGNGDGSFAVSSAPIETGGAFSLGLAVGDANGDGNPDIASPGYECGTLVLTPGVGDGTVRVITNPARAFVGKNKDVIRLNANKANWCVSLEPVGDSFDAAGELRFVSLVSPGTGSVDAISVDFTKPVVVGDADGNNVQDLTVCFAKDRLRQLFANLSGRQAVTVLLRGEVGAPGCWAEAALTVDVVAGGHGSAARIRRDRSGSGWTISYRAERAGSARLRLFDVSGRLVASRTLPDAAAGWNDAPFSGLDDSGRRLPSGVFFYRLDTGDDPLAGKFVLAR